MQTTLRLTPDNGAAAQPHYANGESEICQPPVKAISATTLGTGLAHLVHEINNPLQLVNWTVNMMDTLMPKANGAADPFMGKMFQQLKGGVDQMISLFGTLECQLKSLWMIDPSFDSVDLSSIIDEMLQSEAANFSAGGIGVQKHVAANLPRIQANETLLKQALLNLLRNAAEAMPNGGLLHVRAGAREASVWLELADTGLGIPPDLDAFQPFATSKPGGMGLGLAITRHIFENHGGTIGYKSLPGKGTTFHLTLPLVIDTQIKSAQWDRPDMHNSGGSYKLRALRQSMDRLVGCGDVNRPDSPPSVDI